MDIEHKRGRLSNSEMEFITTNINKLSIPELAEAINKNIEPIEKFIKVKGLIPKTISDEDARKITLLTMLHSREYWSEVKKQFTQDELAFFEELWVNVVLQFGEDVLHTEELDIKQLIILEIKMNRSLVEEKRAREDIERLAKILDKEYAKDDDNRNDGVITSLESQIGSARISIPAYSSEWVKLSEQKDKINKSLKSTRDQRISRIEDSKSTFAGLLRLFDENEEERRKMGYEADLGRLAQEGAFKRLSEYHTFADGQVQQPVLNINTLKEDDLLVDKTIVRRK